jgi:hypothetical protein
MCREELTVNVATERRNLERPVTRDRFDLGMERQRAARQEVLRGERTDGGHRPEGAKDNTCAADLGCVDWYLYPVNRTPTRASR